jgi:FtsP/CotA-like multicopper oxidase with cupredoxin domain
LTVALVAALAAVLAVGAGAADPAADHPHEGHSMEGMQMSAGGMVMNQNTDRLPKDCANISQDVTVTVHAGRKYAATYPGTTYAYDRGAWDVPPCSRVTVRLVNEDHVRHQWMLHGLPRYLYAEGMFHLEVSGPGEGSGTFIVPSVKKTYLVHCDVPQHAEKGMKAELTVAGGDGDLPSIPGVSAPVEADAYRVRWDASTLVLAGAVGIVGAMLGFRALRR